MLYNPWSLMDSEKAKHTIALKITLHLHIHAAFCVQSIQRNSRLNIKYKEFKFSCFMSIRLVLIAVVRKKVDPRGSNWI